MISFGEITKYKGIQYIIQNKATLTGTQQLLKMDGWSAFTFTLDMGRLICADVNQCGLSLCHEIHT